MTFRHFAAVMALGSVLTATALTSALADEFKDADSGPNIVTADNPFDPKYANAGDNLRNGVGSIFIEFNGIPQGGFICTAAVISPRHILTAAHCVLEEGDSVRRLRLILSAGLESPMILDASAFVVHPSHFFWAPLLGAFAHGDIAVVELPAPLPANIEIYPLYTTDDEFFQETRHYGHGVSGKGNMGGTISPDFFFGRTGLNMYEQVLGPFLGTGIEDQLLHDFDSGGKKHNAMEWWFTSQFLCAPDMPNNPPQAQDGQCTTFYDGSFPDFKGFGDFEIGIAGGDSGGPGFIDGKIAGVHSFGFTHFCAGVTNGTDFTCGLDSSYGEMSGDTRVSYYASWIADVLAGNVSMTSIPEPPIEAIQGGAGGNSAQVEMSERARFFVGNVFSRTMRLRVEEDLQD